MSRHFLRKRRKALIIFVAFASSFLIWTFFTQIQSLSSTANQSPESLHEDAHQEVQLGDPKSVKIPEFPVVPEVPENQGPLLPPNGDGLPRPNELPNAVDQPKVAEQQGNADNGQPLKPAGDAHALPDAENPSNINKAVGHAPMQVKPPVLPSNVNHSSAQLYPLVPPQKSDENAVGPGG
ncbi:unnamed protein product [Echinostoma caproni]|uniref:Energy transducer TonB n=1 Tax=Echinostoma caproni TaxID=27848 RepID=A0A183B9X3_9TREM|nr:unnamed protein product [Echinostoma caproni]